ncbi:MAG: M28 family peptidase [Acidobacteria bacterium]|nr:M28 family peptidase [Acidobacteriota bacterium]
MSNPYRLCKATLQTLALTLLLVLTNGCQEQKASVANANTKNANAASANLNANKSEGIDAGRAQAYMKKLVEFGPRPSGSEAIKKTQEYIKSELSSYGLKVMEDKFDGVTPKGKIAMNNIIAELPGEKPEIVIISGHYDTKLMPGFVGANDGGSSTAAVLETARVLAKTKPEYTLWFVFFDGEEAVIEWQGNDNTYGSRHLVAKMKGDGSLNRVKAMILYDMMGDKGLDLKRDDSSSPWLVDVIWRTAAQMGQQKYFLGNDTAIADDHIAFREAGIAAVDLIDFNYGPDNAYWHSNQDTLDKVSGDSVKIVCDVVIQALPEIYKQLDNRGHAAGN